MIYIYYSDVMGDMAFSGGFETLAAGKDTEGWMNVVRSHHADTMFIISFKAMSLAAYGSLVRWRYVIHSNAK